MDRTKIEWADATWNPVMGCTRVSAGCQHCYAERLAARFWWRKPGLGEFTDAGPRWTGEVEFRRSALMDPLRWRKPKRIFVCSMGDLFYEAVRPEWIDMVMAVIAACPQHVFMVLTKRPERMNCEVLSLGSAVWREVLLQQQERLGMPPRVDDWPLPNLWLGVSVENERWARERIPHLMQTPAALRFVSCEPLLGGIDLGTWLPTLEIERESRWWAKDRYLDWVIVGGETGPGARPMHPNWVRRLRDQCQQAGVPFFFKQWGEWLCEDQFGTDGDKPTPANTGCSSKRICEIEGLWFYRVGRRNAGRLLDGRQWDEVPELEGGA